MGVAIHRGNGSCKLREASAYPTTRYSENGRRLELRGGQAWIGGRADGNLRMVIAAAALVQRLEKAIKQCGRRWKRALRQCLLVLSRHDDAKVSRYG